MDRDKMSRLEHSIMLKSIAENLKHLRVDDPNNSESEDIVSF